MRSLLAALCLLLCLSAARAENVSGPTNLILCNKIAVLEAGASGSQIVVPAVAGQTIFVCGWNVTNTGANGTIAMTSGTQTTNPCDTGTKKLSPTFNVSSNSPNQDHSQYATSSSNLSQAVCANPSAATFSVLIWFAQF
jgi:hypothetical protein